MATCAHCSRPVWDDGPITVAVCTGWKSDRCELVRQRNLMAALLTNIIREPTNVVLIEAAKSLLGEVDAKLVDHRCQKCFSPYVVTPTGSRRLHFAKVTDQTPCDGKVP